MCNIKLYSIVLAKSQKIHTKRSDFIPLVYPSLKLTASSPLKTKGGSGFNIIQQPIFRVEILVSGRLLPSEQTYTTRKQNKTFLNSSKDLQKKLYTKKSNLHFVVILFEPPKKFRTLKFFGAPSSPVRFPPPHLVAETQWIKRKGTPVTKATGVMRWQWQFNGSFGRIHGLPGSH